MPTAEQVDAIWCLLVSPFVAGLCVLLACAVAFVARYERRQR